MNYVKSLKYLMILTLVSVAGIGLSVLAEDATGIMMKSHLAYYYAGDDGVADVTMTIADAKRERVKQFTMIRMDIEEGGMQKYYTYFKKPSDIARLTFMVHKDPKETDARWIYVPSVDLIKPISGDDKNSSFVGSDFSYEDVSGRHWNEDTHTLKGDSIWNDSPVFIIESIPNEAYKGFARKTSYIDKTSYLPVLEVYYNKKDKMTRIFRADKIETIDGFPTVTIRSMENLKKKRTTTVDFSSIRYNQKVTEKIFTERFLKTPPRQYIK